MRPPLFPHTLHQGPLFLFRRVERLFEKWRVPFPWTLFGFSFEDYESVEELFLSLLPPTSGKVGRTISSPLRLWVLDVEFQFPKAQGRTQLYLLRVPLPVHAGLYRLTHKVFCPHRVPTSAGPSRTGTEAPRPGAPHLRRNAPTEVQRGAAKPDPSSGRPSAAAHPAPLSTSRPGGPRAPAGRRPIVDGAGAPASFLVKLKPASRLYAPPLGGGRRPLRTGRASPPSRRALVGARATPGSSRGVEAISTSWPTTRDVVSLPRRGSGPCRRYLTKVHARRAKEKERVPITPFSLHRKKKNKTFNRNPVSGRFTHQVMGYNIHSCDSRSL